MTEKADLGKRYKAAARGLDGRAFRVYSAVVPDVCRDGKQHWFDRRGNDYGPIDAENPIWQIGVLEALTPGEAAAVDELFGL